MLDVATAVTSSDPRTTVRAVSRHGMLPQVHRGRGGPADSIWLPALSDTDDPLQGTSVAALSAGWLINATGPGTDLTRSTDPLMRDLLNRGLARPDPLRLGLDASLDGAVIDDAWHAQHHAVHPRAAAARDPLRDDRDPGDPGPGGGPGQVADRGAPGSTSPGQRGLNRLPPARRPLE